MSPAQRVLCTMAWLRETETRRTRDTHHSPIRQEGTRVWARRDVARIPVFDPAYISTHCNQRGTPSPCSHHIAPQTPISPNLCFALYIVHWRTTHTSVTLYGGSRLLGKSLKVTLNVSPRWMRICIASACPLPGQNLNIPQKCLHAWHCWSWLRRGRVVEAAADTHLGSSSAPKAVPAGRGAESRYADCA
jgi:hypothetical protein